MNRWWWTLVLLWGLWACQVQRPSPEPSTPPSPPAILRVDRVPEAAALDALLQACAERVGVLLVLGELAYPPHRPQAQAWVTWGPEPWEPTVPAYALLTWRARPVVHRQVPVQALRVEELEAMYRGTLRTWPAEAGEPLPLRPLLPPPGHPVHQALRDLVAPFPWPGDLLWAPTPGTTLREVQERPGTLGWLPEGWRAVLPPDVRMLRLEDPKARFGPWPVLVQAQEDAPPAARAWMGCLQATAAQGPLPQEVPP